MYKGFKKPNFVPFSDDIMLNYILHKKRISEAYERQKEKEQQMQLQKEIEQIGNDIATEIQKSLTK